MPAHKGIRNQVSARQICTEHLYPTNCSTHCHGGPANGWWLYFSENIYASYEEPGNQLCSCYPKQDPVLHICKSFFIIYVHIWFYNGNMICNWYFPFIGEYTIPRKKFTETILQLPCLKSTPNSTFSRAGMNGPWIWTKTYKKSYWPMVTINFISQKLN